MINITQDQVAKSKIAGRIGSDQVILLSLKGGLFVHVRAGKGKKPEIISTGSHPAVARHVAKKREPDIEWTDLAKAEEVDERCFRHLLPRYEALTERLRGGK